MQMLNGYSYNGRRNADGEQRQNGDRCGLDLDKGKHIHVGSPTVLQAAAVPP